jgi:phosphate transport system substrate-binding protein
VTFTNKLLTGIATLAIAGFVGFTGSASAQTADVPLVESGSSLLYPVLNLWVAAFSASHPGAHITTTSTGSGAGISQAMQGMINIGASDAYMSDPLVAKHPTMMNIPLAVSSQVVNFNLPGVKTLNLSGPVLAKIYEGKITRWNDPAIAAVNPGVSLPAHAIVPLHYADSSGDTFMFTQYLSATDAGWARTMHYGTTMSWPAIPGALGAIGNSGVLTAAATHPYSLAFIGISYASQAAADGLGQVALLNKAGHYVLPTSDTIGAAAASFAASTPADERISMILAPGANAYPIVNYEYAIVDSSQPTPAVAKAVRDFLSYSITAGNAPSFLSKMHFQPLPDSVRALSTAQIAKIK